MIDDRIDDRIDEDLLPSVADAISMSSGVFLVESDSPGSIARDLSAELEFNLDQEEVPIVAQPSSARQIVAAAATATSRSAVIIEGLARLSDDEIQRLDVGRNRLPKDGRVILIVTRADAVRVRRHAPNLSSWIGANDYRCEVEDTEEARNLRLESLRSEFGISDDELVREFETGRRQHDPVVAEWLTLMGRGDLLGGI